MSVFTAWRDKEERAPPTEFQHDHAAANETSIMMSLHPFLVHMENLPKDLLEETLALIGDDPRSIPLISDGTVSISRGQVIYFSQDI